MTLRRGLAVLALAGALSIGSGCAHRADSLHVRGMQPAVSTSEELAAALQPRRIALVIGVDDYHSAAFPDLRFAGEDARAVAEILRGPGEGGFERVVVLDSSTVTSRARILAELRGALADLRREDVFVIYFSGHGTAAVNDEGEVRLYLLVHDSSPGDLEGTAIDLEVLQDFVGSLRAERKALVVDACFHGAGKSIVDPTLTGEIAEALASVTRTRVRGLGSGEAHLFASTLGRPAFEDDELGHGVYTSYLLQSMTWARTAADRDGDGLLTTWEVHDYARERTREHTSSRQIPEAAFRIIGSNDLVLVGDEATRTAKDQVLVYQYGHGSPQLADATLLLDGRAKGVFPGAVPVDPGRHHVEVRAADGTLLVDGYTEFQPGSAVAATDLSVRVREDRGLQSLRVGVGGGPPSRWSDLWGDGMLALEYWGALRKARGKARGLTVGGTLGLGVAPHQTEMEQLVRTGRGTFWAAADLGWSRDFDRFRLLAGWQTRLTLIPVAQFDGEEHDLLPEEAGWFFGSTGPVVHLGVVLDRRLSLVVAATLQVTALDLDADDVAEAQVFGTITTGLEIGL